MLRLGFALTLVAVTALSASLSAQTTPAPPPQSPVPAVVESVTVVETTPLPGTTLSADKVPAPTLLGTSQGLSVYMNGVSTKRMACIIPGSWRAPFRRSTASSRCSTARSSLRARRFRAGLARA